LAPGERAELERLRALVARRKAGYWRGILAPLLIVLGCLLALPAVVAVWSSNQISNTDRYVETVAPLASTPSVQNAVADRVTKEITQRIDVPAILATTVAALEARGLPAQVGDTLAGLSGPIASGFGSFVHDRTLQFTRTDAFKDTWIQVNRIAHRQLNAVLSGNGSKILKVQGDTISLDLGPIIAGVKQKLVDSGLQVAGVIPDVHPTFQLFRSKDLVTAQRGYKLLNMLRWVLPILSLLLVGLGIHLARDHRRALVGAGLGLAAAMLLLVVGLIIGRMAYLNQVVANGLSTAAAQDIFDTLVRFLTDSLRMLMVLGLVVAAGAFFTGPSSTAVRTRTALSGGLAKLRGADRGSVWVQENRVMLRVGVVVLGVLIFAFWGHPTGLVVLLLTLLILLGLAIVEFLAKPPRKAAS
jgi:hypothetical protein